MWYHSFKIEDAEVKGNIANVKVKTKVEVRPTFICRHEFKMAAKEDVVPMTWVWIGDDWYFVFRTPFESQFLYPVLSESLAVLSARCLPHGSY